MSEFVSVADAASFSPGHGRTVRAQGREIAVYNLDGQFYALDDQCPHRGGPLGAGTLEDGRVFCPLHGWSFDLKTGACLNVPERSVKTHRTRVCDGQLQICLGGDDSGAGRQASE